jgi:hypothetical protein
MGSMFFQVRAAAKTTVPPFLPCPQKTPMPSHPIPALFQQIADGLPGARLSNMFGCPCIKAPNGKAGAFAWRGQLIIKPAAAELAGMLQQGYEEFCPMEGGRPMKGWILVPEAQSEQWLALAEASYERASLLPAKRG